MDNHSTTPVDPRVLDAMLPYFREDFGIYTRVARFHNVYGPLGTWQGGREKAPAAICRKVLEAKASGKHEIVFKFEPEHYVIGEKTAFAGSILWIIVISASLFMSIKIKLNK